MRRLDNGRRLLKGDTISRKKSCQRRGRSRGTWCKPPPDRLHLPSGYEIEPPSPDPRAGPTGPADGDPSPARPEQGE